MSFTFIENSVMDDDWTASFDKVPEDNDVSRHNAKTQIDKHWNAMKGDVDGLNGLKLTKPDANGLIDALIKSNTHAVMCELVLTKSELRLDVEVDKTTINAGKVRVPTDLEDYRTFIGNLNGWSTGGHNIVPDAEFKKFNANNPKKPPKPTWKDYDDMAKKSKGDTADFRDWAKTKAKKALDDFDKADKAAKKPNDPARAAALKTLNAAYQQWLGTF
jgi:hypothetical protein